MNHFVVDFFLRSTLPEEILASERNWEFPRKRYWNPATLSITWRQFMPLSRCAFTARQLLS